VSVIRATIYTNFSQNHYLREFCNLYLVEYNREAKEIAQILIYDKSLLPENRDKYTAASFDNTATQKKLFSDLGV